MITEVTYAVEGYYPKRRAEGREWKIWVSGLTEEAARSTYKTQLKQKKQWLKECFTDLRIVRVTTTTEVLK